MVRRKSNINKNEANKSENNVEFDGKVAIFKRRDDIEQIEVVCVDNKHGVVVFRYYTYTGGKRIYISTNSRISRMNRGKRTIKTEFACF